MNSAGRARWLTVVAWTLSVAVAAIIGGWATRTAFLPPSIAETEAPLPLYTVEEASVGLRGDYTATAEWPTTPVAPSAATGTVTAVHVKSGESLSEGEAVFEIDLKPLIVIAGSVPMFRDLGPGVEGEDVRQLQDFLYRNKWLAVEPDGIYGAKTQAAVKRWQFALGAPQSGEVRRGDILFATQLPMRVALAEKLKVGAVVGAGEELLFSVASQPMLTIDTASNQREASLASGMRAIVHVGEDQVEAVLGEQTAGGDQVELVASPGGGSACEASCALPFPFTRESAKYRAEVIISEEVRGPSVPPSALGVTAAGEPFVIAADGRRVPVAVRAKSASRVVIDGIDAGTQVRLFSSTDSAEMLSPEESG